MTKIFAALVFFTFIFQIGYLSYKVPQIIILGESFPQEVKMSAVVAGICLGTLLIIKKVVYANDSEEESE